jgi:hypothetical protein
MNSVGNEGTDHGSEYEDGRKKEPHVFVDPNA